MKAEKLAGGTMVISLPSGLYQLGGTKQVTDQFIFISVEKVKVKGTQSCPTLCDPVGTTVRGILQARILEWVACPFSGGSTPTQGWNPGLPHGRRILYQLSLQGSPRILEWAAYPFSRGSSQPRDQTQVSQIAGGLFTS